MTIWNEAKSVKENWQNNSSSLSNNVTLLQDKDDSTVVNKEIAKQDDKIAKEQEKANSYLTDNDVVNSVITTSQAERTPYQQAIANLNPDLKGLNTKYMNSINKIWTLENEKVNLAEARQIMQQAYQAAINNTNKAAERMMWANMANANIQAWAAVSASRWLSTNPAAAAATRMSAQNQAAIQNASVRSQADQNIANMYSNMANIPQSLASIAQANSSIAAQDAQTLGNALQLQKQLLEDSNSNTSSGWTRTVYVNNNTDTDTKTPDVITMIRSVWNTDVIKKLMEKQWVTSLLDVDWGKEENLKVLQEAYQEYVKNKTDETKTDETKIDEIKTDGWTWSVAWTWWTITWTVIK